MTDDDSIYSDASCTGSCSSLKSPPGDFPLHQWLADTLVQTVKEFPNSTRILELHVVNDKLCWESAESRLAPVNFLL